MKRLIDKTQLLGARQIGGIVYAYWPADYSKPVNKAAVREISIRSVQELADYALPKDVTLTLETVNRFEQFLFNDAAEAVQFVKDVNRENVKVMLDSFHMNIEEDSFYDAIVSTGSYLGHFHIGEPNRNGTVVMEPFVRPGGGVGADIKVWRDLSDDASDEQLDEDIAESCRFVRKAFCG